MVSFVAFLPAWPHLKMPVDEQVNGFDGEN